MAVITRCSYKRGGRKARFHCSYFLVTCPRLDQNDGITACGCAWMSPEETVVVFVQCFSTDVALPACRRLLFPLLHAKEIQWNPVNATTVGP